MNAMPMDRPRALGRLNVATVTLAHGGGGKAMKDLIDDVFISEFEHAPSLLEDQARLALSAFAAYGDRVAFTTDSFVVDPLFFPGGDIGKLSVCGTINDLACGGARPQYLSCAAVIEEGLPVETLRKVARSMAETAREAGVSIVTGDTKVVERGACDKLFLTTAGIGSIPSHILMSVGSAQSGDAIIVNGQLGDHGATILAARGNLKLQTPIASDCAPLNGMIEMMLAAVPAVRFIRDCTRGGLATVLNEAAEASQMGIEIDEAAIPMREDVKAFCEILGLDPLYLANEGKIAAIVPEESVQNALSVLRSHAYGRDATVIGRVTRNGPGRVTMRTLLGGWRIVDMLVGEQLPRIC